MTWSNMIGFFKYLKRFHVEAEVRLIYIVRENTIAK